MKVTKQFIREFCIPTLIAILWSYFNSKDISGTEKVVVSIKNFGAAFFLSSWFGAQILRIIKQQKLESSLSNLLERLEKVSDKIENVYKDLRGYTTGGESFCYLDVGRYGDTYIQGVVHNGVYPLYDISMRFHDLNNKDHEDLNNRPTLEIGDLGPGLVSSIEEEDFKPEENPENYIKYEISFYCRKGHFIQDLRLIKFEKNWYTALQVREEDKVIFTKMDEDFPIKEPFKK
ncbi:MAG: hypothetical protein ACXVPN_04395 [Bacteroidia bacterium]